jgi:hypothetical protein
VDDDNDNAENNNKKNKTTAKNTKKSTKMLSETVVTNSMIHASTNDSSDSENVRYIYIPNISYKRFYII